VTAGPGWREGTEVRAALRRRRVVVSCVAVGLAGIAALAIVDRRARLERDELVRLQGSRLFHGEPAEGGTLRGRLAGHPEDLPAEATRCANCHAGGPGGQASAARDYAPRLNAHSLALPKARRGGPPSAYDPKAFCKLLREGVDPAWVLVDQSMPRYAATDAQCAALWAFLAPPGPAGEGAAAAP
jgi:hypothetical protein